MSLEQQQAQSPEQTETEATELSNNLRLRSRTSTTTTTSSTASNSKNELPLTTTMAYTTTSSLPSPVIPQPTPKPQKSSRGGARKSNKSTRRSSLNQKKENSSKKKSNSPPILPNNPAQQHQQQEQTIPEDDANITRCVCGEDNEEANDVIMFQCDKCSVWQHGPCVGLYAEFPGDYFCEKCRPDLHTTGQYQKSTSHQPTRRSPSFTSSSSRRERVNPDAASLAAFLTDAGVKPEDQLSLGGFALPTFAQTRRQSNMLVDGVVPLAQKKQTAMDTSSSGTAESTLLPSAVNDLNKAKRKRPSLDQIESPILPSVEPALEDKLKRPRISPGAELPSPAASVSTTTSKLYNPPSASSLFSGPIGKHKRSRKVDETDESSVGTSNSKNKATGVFNNNRNPVSVSTSATGRRGSPTKRSKEDGRRTKQQVTEQQAQQQQQQQRQQQIEAMLSEGWGLPDHLSYLDYLLPTPFPQPLIIEDLGDGPDAKIYETPAKVKFPSKRTTIADLRKRSKHLVDYLQKVQIESSDREKRNELIAKSLASKQQQQQQPLPTIDPSNPQQSSLQNSHSHCSFDSSQPVVSSKTLEIIDDLSRQLYHWQEKFKQN
ncbi:hypothetical protein PGT21_022367 [Puccinia graminis f. sp. tritici]|uniref:Zinc finger PHD-type domain-containing protein n=1 Tax=Puccinia graminis f. sp. tritici TaxID=56615 RepID=A0A5B0RE28_PUCGR|nr:hypothetical protein PGT21_022367 [Puccinia graminis f. sp. tritici]KAA1124071.1 hypothetical protein PGTUg99_025443 [Puccinia graminis f. sp. tritici]